MPARYVGIDGLRALAVLAVLAHHWAAAGTPDAFPLGRFGVRLFFVISGFLITEILLRARAQMEAGGGLGAQLRSFYARRCLRILPPYYLVLLLAAAAGVGGVLHWLPWHLGFVSNIAMALEDSWLKPSMPFWSLAVEEQFYLVWPFVILLAPRRALIPIVLAMIAASPLFRWALFQAGAGEIAINVLAPASFEALGLGALLALWRPGPRLIAAGALLAPPLLLAVMVLVARQAGGPAEHVWLLPAASLCSAILLAAVLRWPDHPGFVALRVGPLPAIGVISYGVYLYHLFVELAVDALFGLPEGLVRYGLLFGGTFAAAALSWRFVEQPILSLKRHLPPGPAQGTSYGVPSS